MPERNVEFSWLFRIINVTNAITGLGHPLFWPRGQDCHQHDFNIT